MEDHIQYHSIAPTLPIHSPHSPLLTDHLKRGKLSARYINNTSFLCNTTSKSTATDNSKHETENSSSTHTSASTTSSKLLCYCEKRGTENLERKNNIIALESGVTKRLVPTRNAATSPHLDIRKLGSMTMLTPSPSLSNELCMKSTDRKNNKFIIKNSNISKMDKNENNKKKIEKHNSTEETKPQKQLRTTRSLSPRPPIRHQHALLVSDSSNFKIQLPNTQVNKICRSEQSSPNIIDGTDIQFSYDTSTNRSTSCLGNIFSDPWLKVVASDDIPSSQTSSTYEKKLNPSNNIGDNKDPWVKRNDLETIPKASRQELFRQSKSFSASKFDIENVNRNSRTLASSKSPNYKNGEISSTSNKYNVKKQLQSAPSSPQVLGTVENFFTSYTYLNNQQFVNGHINDKSPTRSTSFSPARIKDSSNPFTEYNLNICNSPPPSISVDPEINNKEHTNTAKLNIRSTDYEFLNVCNPNFLNARHSFSSVCDQQQGEELQLNIRRLSDQMRRKESIFPNSIKTYSSDRNVRENVKDESILFKSSKDTNKVGSEKVQINRADFSEYLEQFRWSEAKKVATVKEKTSLWKSSNKKITTTQINQPIEINKTQQSSDCLLETTC